MRKVLFLAFAGLLGVAQVLSAQDRFALSNAKVAIYNVAGEIRLEAGSGANVVVEVTRGGDDGDRLAVERGDLDGWQTLIVKYPDERIIYRPLGRVSRTSFNIREDGTFGTKNLDPDLGAERIKKGEGGRWGGRRIHVAGAGRGVEAHADIRVLVPAGGTVAVHLGAGKLFVNNVDGDIQLDARSASVEAKRVSGFGRIDTGSGSVSLSGGNGNFGLHTGSGGVKVTDVRNGALVIGTGSGSVNASDLDVSELMIGTGSGGVTVTDAAAPTSRIGTGSGGIRAQRFGASNFDLRTGSGGVRVELTSDIQFGRIDTGSGSVTISAPRDLGAEIMIDTGSGGIDVEGADIVVSEKRRGYMRGRIGDGRGTLEIDTGSGGVSFRSY